jgi:hypothetical protein
VSDLETETLCLDVSHIFDLFIGFDIDHLCQVVYVFNARHSLRLETEETCNICLKDIFLFLFILSDFHHKNIYYNS